MKPSSTHSSALSTLAASLNAGTAISNESTCVASGSALLPSIHAADRPPVAISTTRKCEPLRSRPPPSSARTRYRRAAASESAREGHLDRTHRASEETTGALLALRARDRQRRHRRGIHGGVHVNLPLNVVRQQLCQGRDCGLVLLHKGLETRVKVSAGLIWMDGQREERRVERLDSRVGTRRRGKLVPHASVEAHGKKCIRGDADDMQCFREGRTAFGELFGCGGGEAELRTSASGYRHDDSLPLVSMERVAPLPDGEGVQARLVSDREVHATDLAARLLELIHEALVLCLPRRGLRVQS